MCLRPWPICDGNCIILVDIDLQPKKLSSVHTIVVAEVDSDLLENTSIR